MGIQNELQVACPICGDEGPKTSYTLTERMFGFGDEFPYLMCSACGLLWLAEVPEDMSRYYPSHYISMIPLQETLSYDKDLKWRLLQMRDRYEWTGQGWIGKQIAKRKPNPKYKLVWPLEIKAKDKVLDVGCGRGHLLKELHAVGITAHGVDPFIESDFGNREEGFWIRKGELSDQEGPYDVIMMHHSLEHMPNQKQVMKDCRRLLNPGGRVMIRIPTVSCEAWDRYGVYWYELDAPRHFYLHSRQSILKLATDAGFRLVSMTDDSSANQFAFSELYKLGIPLNSLDPVVNASREEALSKMPMDQYEAETEKANRSGKGDRIAVVLTH